MTIKESTMTSEKATLRFDKNSIAMVKCKLPVELKASAIIDKNCVNAPISKYDFLRLPQMAKLSDIKPYRSFIDQGSIIVAMID